MEKDNSKEDFMEIRDDTVDVRKIMEEIRSRIKERGIQEVDFPDTLSLANEIGELPENPTMEDDRLLVNTTWDVMAERPITSHRRFLGPILVFGKKVVRKLLRWYVNPFVDQQRNFNAAMVRLMNSTQTQLDEKKERISELEQTVQDLEEKERKQEKLLQTDYKGALYRVEENIRGLNQFADSYQDVQLMQNEKLRRLQREISGNGTDTAVATGAAPAGGPDSQEAGTTGKAAPAAENTKISPDPKAASGSGAETSASGETKQPEEGIDYFMFEMKYRGSRAKIKESQRKYLKYLEGKNRILDIGCGRGEFVELLTKQGKTGVRGIDINEDMVTFCRDKHLPVEYGDAITYLQSVPQGELEGIYMGQVVEHLPYEDMIRLIRLAYEKLADDGVFIIETLNPMCLAIFSNAFYMDVSHRKPVHPLTLEFILKSTGFSSVENIYFSEIRDKIPALRGSGIENEEEFNAAMGRVNDLLFGMQDYAAIARK